MRKREKKRFQVTSDLLIVKDDFQRDGLISRDELNENVTLLYEKGEEVFWSNENRCWENKDGGSVPSDFVEEV